MADEIIGCEIAGLETLDKQLSRFAEEVRISIVQKALANAAVILAETQIAHAPERTDNVTGGNALPPGALKNDIRVEVDMDTSYGYSEARIGPGPNTDYVARFVEEGHEMVTHGRRARDRRAVGRVAPHPFIQPAFDEAANAALDAFGTTVMAGIAQNTLGPTEADSDGETL